MKIIRLPSSTLVGYKSLWQLNLPADDLILLADGLQQIVRDRESVRFTLSNGALLIDPEGNDGEMSVGASQELLYSPFVGHFEEIAEGLCVLADVEEAEYNVPHIHFAGTWLVSNEQVSDFVVQKVEVEL